MTRPLIADLRCVRPALMSKLGKFKTGKGCLYIKQLSDIDLGVLEKLIEKSAKL